MGSDPAGQFKMTNGVSFPPGMRFVIELVVLGIMLGGLYYALSGRIDIVYERVDAIRAGQARMEESVKEVLQEHDRRLDAVEQGTAPIIRELKEEVKNKRR